MSSRSLVYCLPLPLALACAEPPSGGDSAQSDVDASVSAEARTTYAPAEEVGSADSDDPIWAPLAPLHEARSHHAAARITAFSDPTPESSRPQLGTPLAHEGQVLVVGGYGEAGEPLASSERFDPARGRWELGAELRTPRGAPAAASYFNAEVGDFRLFVAGGEGPAGTPLASVERYSARSATFQLYSALQTPRVAHTLDLIRIPGIPLAEILLVTGGSDGQEILATSEILLAGEPAGSLDTLNEARRDHASALYSFPYGTQDSDSAGAVVVTGGEGADGLLRSAEIYEVAMIGGELAVQQSGWGEFGALSEARKHHTMTAVGGGLLVAGGLGEDGEPLTSAEVFAEGWSLTGEMNVARAHHTATRLFDGRVLVVGGTTEGAAHPEIWDPDTGTWTLLDDLPCASEARHGHAAALLSDGSLMVAGGVADEDGAQIRLATAERYSLDGGILAQGDVCSRDCQCETGHCVDGVCCDRACEGSCEACHLPDSEGTCTLLGAGFQGDPLCDGFLLCNGAEPLCPERCAVDAECAGGLVCENGSCVDPYECAVDQDCAAGRICEDGRCVSEAGAEGLIGWSCATAGNARGGGAGAFLLAMAIVLVALRRRRAARAAGIGLAAGLAVFTLPAPASAEPAATDEPAESVYGAQGATAQPSLGASSSRRGYDPSGGAASRLRLGVGAFGDAVASHAGVEVGAGFQATRWLDLGLAASIGERIGGRVTATIEPLDLPIIRPFVQARGGLHATDDSVLPAAGTWLGAAIEAGPGRFRAGFLGEYFGNPDDYRAWAAGAMVGYEFGPASRRPRAQPEPIVVERVVEVEVEADPPPPTQTVRGLVLDARGAQIDRARVELWAAGGDEPLAVWESTARFEHEVAAGPHELRIRAPEYTARIHAFDVHDGETVVFHAELMAEPKEPAVAELTDERIEVSQQIRFELDSARLHADSNATLDEVGRILQENPDLHIRVEGHTDSTGEPAYNLNLSKQRAAAVVTYLVALGIDEERLESEGFGDTRPVADNATDEGRAQNRRVQFEIVSR
jgi:outer membrane protein OmpA-like peptidoglycan-associated protein